MWEPLSEKRNVDFNIADEKFKNVTTLAATSLESVKKTK